MSFSGRLGFIQQCPLAGGEAHFEQGVRRPERAGLPTINVPAERRPRSRARFSSQGKIVRPGEKWPRQDPRKGTVILPVYLFIFSEYAIINHNGKKESGSRVKRRG